MTSSKSITQTKNRPGKAREPYATIIDLVAERDREFFVQHPDETAYLRPLIPGEIPDFASVGLQDQWVIVHSLGLGMRCRQPIGELLGHRPLPSRLSVILPDGTLRKDVPVQAGGEA